MTSPSLGAYWEAAVNACAAELTAILTAVEVTRPDWDELPTAMRISAIAGRMAHRSVGHASPPSIRLSIA